MTKDLITVGQRGVAVIDENTPSNIKGIFTSGIETCLALYLVGNDYKKHALLHIDGQTSAESIDDFFAENFSHIDDQCLLFNAVAVGGNKELMSNVEEILEKFKSLKNFTLDKQKSKQANLGTVLITIGMNSVNIDCSKIPSQLQDRSTYDRDFKNYRASIHYINGIFGNEASNHEFPLDLQYDSTRYTKLPQLINSKLASDLELLREMNLNETVEWLVSDQALEKYSHLKPLRSSHAHLQVNFAQQIKRYFEYQEKCQLTEYKIPLIDAEREREIKNFSFAIGEEAELANHRRTDWSDLYYSVKLKSGALNKELRESIGLDRLRITKPTETQEEELLNQVPNLVIEDDKNDTGKSLVTFPLGGENRKIITEITGAMIVTSSQKAVPNLTRVAASKR